MSFTNDIQQMMHGFGDCRKPLVESAALIEKILLQQMSSLLQLALDVCEMRGARVVGPEDILFVLRKDHLKLQRLINYMGVRDLYQRTTALSSGTASKDFVDAAAETEVSRKKICTSFLQSIDQVGEYDLVCAGALNDTVKAERAFRQDNMAQGMSAQRYREYCEARRASFCPRLRVNKFREWLLADENSEIKLSQYVLEMLNFLAYETVAQIVDLALLVKRDANCRNSDLSRYQAPSLLNPDYPSVLIQQGNLLQGNIDPNHDSKVGMDPITPDEIREAVRRYWANNSVMASFTKNRSPLGTRLLAG